MSKEFLKEQVLYLQEIYPSIQGESTFVGLPTVFVRTSACNLRCTWCDTPYAFGKGQPCAIPDIFDKINSYGLSNVCITGGEPLLQEPVRFLMSQLCDNGLRVSIETGGSLPIHEIDNRVSIILDIKCPGSGMDHKNHWKNIDHLKSSDEVKFVLLNEHDYEWAKQICMKHSLFDMGSTILFSPVHGELCPQLLVEWVVRDRLPIRVNIQIHKYIWTPETQGV